MVTMSAEIHRLRDKAGDSEKITINLGFVDLGHIDLLVREGFYSNRTDFIRTAIRNQLASHADAVRQSIVRRTLELGLRRFGREELEAVKAKGGRLNIQVVGLATIDDDVTPELALATIEFDHRPWRASRQQGGQGGARRPHRVIDPASLFANKDQDNEIGLQRGHASGRPAHARAEADGGDARHPARADRTTCRSRLTSSAARKRPIARAALRRVRDIRRGRTAPAPCAPRRANAAQDAERKTASPRARDGRWERS